MFRAVAGWLLKGAWKTTGPGRKGSLMFGPRLHKYVLCMKLTKTYVLRQLQAYCRKHSVDGQKDRQINMKSGRELCF